MSGQLPEQRRVALVTGGSGAIGAEVVHALCEDGTRVAIGWHRQEARAGELVESIRNRGGDAMAVQLDHGDPTQVAEAMAMVESTLGVVQVIVAAAVTWPEPEETWADLVSGLVINLAGPIHCVEQALPGMRRRHWGRVVVISTDLVDQPLPTAAGYPAAKGGLESATRVWATREAPYGILSNVVRPGFTLTDKVLRTPGLGQPVVDAESARTPTGRICSPRDVATIVTFLASEANTHVNGQTISVAGGRELTR